MRAKVAGVSEHTPDLPPESDRLDDLRDPAQFGHALRVLTDETDRLMDTVKALDDAAVREPSLCEGWDRAMLLTHVARNADALCNLVSTVATGDVVPMYPSEESRDEGIRAGAGRSAAEIEADVETSADRFLDAFVALPAGHDVTVGLRKGATLPSYEIGLMRSYEIVLHHLDLGTGYDLDRADPALLDRVLAEGCRRTTARGGRPTTLRDDGGAEWHVGDGGPVVEGSRGALVAWVTGRADGSALQGDLPDRPFWG